MQPQYQPSSLTETADRAESEKSKRAIDHYQREGYFRTADIADILGDIKGVGVGVLPAWLGGQVDTTHSTPEVHPDSKRDR